jgi:hypothetical protein
MCSCLPHAIEAGSLVLFLRKQFRRAFCIEMK